MRIWKWQLLVNDCQKIMMPAGAILLDVQMQDILCCIWALCDENAPMVPRYIGVYGTGNPIPNDPGKYIATFQTHGGAMVFHVFEITEKPLLDEAIPPQ